MSVPSLLDLSMYSNLREPNIVKAQFILSQTRIYNLEFDQNISMHELKLMIQNAAHLRSKHFRLFSNGEEYTNYEDQTFESIFPNQKLVTFTLEINLGEESDEMELLLQMNCPCNLHIDKFLLYYCFTCGESICCDCFTKGVHQGHKIQDKCFYLLPSKILVEKLFEDWSKNPYEDYKYSEDQTIAELRTNINQLMFDKIFETLKNIQNKVTKIIEQYHYINFQSFEAVRNSVRDIKMYCIKLLDNLKEKMNIKDVVNNEHIFLDFDKAYKKLGNLQKNKFQFNYQSYQDFNQQIPGLIKNLVNDINDKLVFSLNNILNDQRYDNIITQIQIKAVKGFQQEEIFKEVTSHIKEKYDDFTKKRLSLNYIYNDYEDKKREKLDINVNRGRKTFGPNDISSIHLINPNTFSFGNNIIREQKEYPNLFNNNSQIINLNKNINNNNKLDIKISAPEETIINNNGQQHQIIKTVTTTTIEKKVMGVPSATVSTGNIQSDVKIYPNSKNNIEIHNKNNKKESYCSAQANREVLFTEDSALNNINPPLIYSENKNIQKINLVKNTLNDSFSSNSTIKNLNQIGEQNRNGQASISSYNISNNKEISNKTLSSYIKTQTSNNLFNNQQNARENVFGVYGFNAIPEEMIESESESYFYGEIKNLINKDYILAPISQTNHIKIVTSDIEEKTIPLKFPNNIDINTFLLDCSYCNYNKILYVTGGIINDKKTNIALAINLAKKDNQITVLSPMNYYRSGHSMISFNNYLFVVGGKDQSSVERYNISDNIWEKLSPMNYKRMHPILVVNDGYLYAFFGKSLDNEYCNTIERIRICHGMEKEKWEMIQFSNPKNIDTRIYGCGVYVINDILYLFGGKYNEKKTNNILYFNFEKKLLEKEVGILTANESFGENQLYEIGGKMVQISDDNYKGIYITVS